MTGGYAWKGQGYSKIDVNEINFNPCQYRISLPTQPYSKQWLDPRDERPGASTDALVPELKNRTESCKFACPRSLAGAWTGSVFGQAQALGPALLTHPHRASERNGTERAASTAADPPASSMGFLSRIRGKRPNRPRDDEAGDTLPAG